MCGIPSTMGKSFQNSEESSQDYPLGLSDSDSWSRIVKEGERIFWPYCELINGSLFIIGETELDHLYISKFNSSGNREWELIIKLKGDSYISYVFDNENNLFILSKYYSSKNISLVKVNSSGAVLFSKEISLELSSYDLALVLSDNNSLLVLGYYDQRDHPKRFFLMKFNNVGQFLWNTSYYIDYAYNSYFIEDSGNNIYLQFWNNSINYLAKFNSSGVILWQTALVDGFETFLIDSNEELFVVGEKSYTTVYIHKLNSTGNRIEEILIEYINGKYLRVWYLDDLFVFNYVDMSLLCYDLNLNLIWNSSLSDYLGSYWLAQTFLAKDSHDNVYILQNNGLGNIDLVKISSTGNFLSQKIWGGGTVKRPRSLNIDLDNNVYFLCNCEYSNIWGYWAEYTILVKNPVNGGIPPELKRELVIEDYFIFSVIGISCIISLLALLSILRSNKRRIS